MPALPVPVIIVSGFLGTGKTTLINFFLKQKDTLRVGILTNETGSQTYEAWNYHVSPIRLENLNAHCLSCLGLDRLEIGIDRLIKRSRPEIVFIEASGLTHLPSLLGRLETSRMHRTLQLAGVVQLVDALNWRTHFENYTEAQNGLKIASIVFVSKAPLASPSELENLRLYLQQLKPELPVYERPEQIPWGELLSGNIPSLNPRFLAHHHEHSDLSFLEYSQNRPLSLEGLRDFLHQNRENLFRIKGQLYLKHPSSWFNRYIINRAYALTRLDARPWQFMVKRSTQLLLVGRNLDKEQLFKELDSLAG